MGAYALYASILYPYQDGAGPAQLAFPTLTRSFHPIP